MSIQQKFNLTRIINTRGTFTPLGVSRSSHKVSSAVAEALSSYFIIDELQDVASEVIASFANSEAGTVTHCTAAGITLSVAATMAGSIPEHIASLPDSTGMPDAVVIPAGHCVNYGHRWNSYSFSRRKTHFGWNSTVVYFGRYSTAD